MKKQLTFPLHPFVIFWLGVLTGAIIVGLAFFYRVAAPEQYQSAITSPYSRSFNYKKPLYTVPSTTITPSIVDPYAIGDPPAY